MVILYIVTKKYIRKDNRLFQTQYDHVDKLNILLTIGVKALLIDNRVLVANS